MTGQHEVSSTSEEMGRRKFMIGIVGVVAGAVGFVIGLPAIGYVISPGVKRKAAEQWYPLGPVSILIPGEPMGFPYSYQVQDGWQEMTVAGTAYAVTQDGVNVTVFSDLCTHLSCRVTWKEETGIFLCPCHDGGFNAAGQVVAGPPPRPLDEFENRIEDGQIQILLGA
jgi:menaquinol-cytochrome c reductase iron-sulfur subunit